MSAINRSTPSSNMETLPGRNKYQMVTNLPLRAKLMITFLLIILIPLGLLAYLNNRNTRTVLTEKANQGLFAGASQMADALDTFIQINLDATRTEAQLPALAKYLSLPDNRRAGSAEEAEAAATLRSLSRKDPINISSYALLDKHGIDM